MGHPHTAKSYSVQSVRSIVSQLRNATLFMSGVLLSEQLLQRLPREFQGQESVSPQALNPSICRESTLEYSHCGSLWHGHKSSPSTTLTVVFKPDFTIMALLSHRTLGNLKIFTKAPKTLWKFPGRQDSKLCLALSSLIKVSLTYKFIFISGAQCNDSIIVDTVKQPPW